MLFEKWAEGKGYDLKKLTKKEGRELYRQFGEEMAPVVRDCTDFFNAAMKRINEDYYKLGEEEDNG